MLPTRPASPVRSHFALPQQFVGRQLCGVKNLVHGSVLSFTADAPARKTETFVLTERHGPRNYSPAAGMTTFRMLTSTDHFGHTRWFARCSRLSHQGRSGLILGDHQVQCLVAAERAGSLRNSQETQGLQFLGFRGDAASMRFAILTHDHPFPHWDLLLEAGETCRTWRLLANPDSEGPIPAEILPDHRVFYLDYEGPVSGNRGTVLQWDSGECTWLTARADLVRVICRGNGGWAL